MSINFSIKHFGENRIKLAPFQHGFKDLALLGNFFVALTKLIIETDVSFFYFSRLSKYVI